MKSKNKKPVENLQPVNCTAVTVTKNGGGSLLSEAFELEIINGVVVSVKELTRASDSLAMSIGKCSAKLWTIIREQTKAAFYGVDNEKD